MDRDSADPIDPGIEAPRDTTRPEAPATPASAAPSGAAPSPPTASAALSPAPPGSGARASDGAARRGRGARPELVEAKEPVYREAGGYRFKLEARDLARLRELPGSKGKTDEELGHEFLAAQTGRLISALAGDVAAPAEIRVVVDPFSRQAFLALENRIRAILSF